MIKNPEDIEKATLREVVEWMDKHPVYENTNERKIWEKIIEIFNEKEFDIPKKWWDYDPW